MHRYVLLGDAGLSGRFCAGNILSVSLYLEIAPERFNDNFLGYELSMLHRPYDCVSSNVFLICLYRYLSCRENINCTHNCCVVRNYRNLRSTLSSLI